MVSLPSFTPCTGIEPFLEGKPKALLTMYPAEVTFGNTVLNTDSNESTILLKNDGTDVVAVTEITVVGDFALASDPIVQVLAGETIALQVSFHPTKAGALTGGIHIGAELAEGHKFVKLVGSGVLAPATIPQFHQLIGVENQAIAAVNIVAGTYALIASGTFDGASIQLQWRPDAVTPWVDIAGAVVSSASESVYGIPLTSGQVRVLIGGGGTATSLDAQLTW